MKAFISHHFKTLAASIMWLIGGASLVYADLQRDVEGAVQDITPDVRAVRNVDEAVILREAQDIIFQFVGIVAVVMILWMGIKFMTAQGNVEEFKKQAKAMIFIIIGLALIPLSYFFIRFITNLNL